MTACACCGGPTAPHRAIRTYDYHRCAACGYTFLPDRSSHEQLAIYDDAYFEGGGAGYDDYTAEAGLIRDRGRWYAARLAPLMPAGTLLDAGCAAGYFMQGMRENGWRCTGAEPNLRMAQLARSHGFEVWHGGLESARADMTFDLISMIQVAAHFYDVEAALEAAARATAANGYWLIETWNAASLTARLLRTQWHEYSPPSVLRIFTPQALDALAARYGFEPVAAGRPRKEILASHAASLLQSKRREGALAAALATVVRTIPPRARLPYPAEDLMWRLYRRGASCNARVVGGVDFPNRRR